MSDRHPMQSSEQMPAKVNNNKAKAELRSGL
jgi:hypothetical protein